MTVMLATPVTMIVRVAVALPIAIDRGDRDDRRGGSRGRGRGSDRNPRYATDDNYDTTAPTAKSVLSARVAASVATLIRSRTKALSRIGRGIAAPSPTGSP